MVAAARCGRVGVRVTVILMSLSHYSPQWLLVVSVAELSLLVVLCPSADITCSLRVRTRGTGASAMGKKNRGVSEDPYVRSVSCFWLCYCGKCQYHSRSKTTCSLTISQLTPNSQQWCSLPRLLSRPLYERASCGPMLLQHTAVLPSLGMTPPTDVCVSLVVQSDGLVQSSLRCVPSVSTDSVSTKLSYREPFNSTNPLSSPAPSNASRAQKNTEPPVVLAGLPSFTSLLSATLVEQGKELSHPHPLLSKALTSSLTRLLPFISVEPPLTSDAVLPSGDYKFSTSSKLTHSGLYDLGQLSLPATVTYAATHSQPAVTYSGDIDATTLSGAGDILWPATAAEYEGDVSSGLRHGHGKLSLPNIGAAYTGSFKQGLRHGHGKVTYEARGTQYYVGGWHDGTRHGQGVMRYTSGNTYDGQWQHNHKHGSGTMHWHTHHITYTGQWADDQPNGQGCYKWTTSGRLSLHHPLYNTYRGEVQGGERHGRGSFLYADGGEWHGEWKAGKKDGSGVWVWVNGSEMVGEWKDDELQGEQARQQWAERDIQHLDLQLSDMLPHGGAEDKLSAVRVLLERYDSVMRAVYKQFASFDPSQQWAGKEGFVVRLHLQQLWLCLQHFGLLDAVGTVELADVTAGEEKVERSRVRRADVNRLLFRRYSHSTAVQRRRAIEWDSMHDDRHALLYREFAELLARLSPLVYPSPSSLSTSLGQLLSSIAAQRSRALPAPLFSQHASFVAALRENATTVSSLFTSIAARSVPSQTDNSRFTDLTTTSTDLLTLLTSSRISSRIFTAHYTPLHLARLLPADPIVELVEAEVCDVVLRVAVYQWQVEAEKERLRNERFAVRLDTERQRADDKQRKREAVEAEAKRVAEEQQAQLAAEAEAAKDKAGKGKGNAKPAAAAAAKRPASKQTKAKPGKKGGKADEEDEKTAEELATEAKEEEERKEEVSELMELLVEGVEEEEAEREAVYPLCWADRASGEVEEELGAERMAQLLQSVHRLLASLQCD